MSRPRIIWPPFFLGGYFLSHVFQEDRYIELSTIYVWEVSDLLGVKLSQEFSFQHLRKFWYLWKSAIFLDKSINYTKEIKICCREIVSYIMLG